MDHDVHWSHAEQGRYQQMKAHLPPAFLMEWIENGPLALLCQVSHHLGDDKGSETDQGGEVMWAPLVYTILFARPEPQQCPEETVGGDVDCKSRLRESPQ